MGSHWASGTKVPLKTCLKACECTPILTNIVIRGGVRNGVQAGWVKCQLASCRHALSKLVHSRIGWYVLLEFFAATWDRPQCSPSFPRVAFTCHAMPGSLSDL